MTMSITVPPTAGTALQDEFPVHLQGRNRSTVDAYMRALRQLSTWLAQRPGSGGVFRPEQFTRTSIETYLGHLAHTGYSISHRARTKAAASVFARWLIEAKELLRRNPTRGVEIPAQQTLAPRQLTADQRYILRNLVERDGELRTEALFALGYWAGCRVSDVAWLRMEDTHVGPKIGWLHVGHKGGKTRDNQTTARYTQASREQVKDFALRGRLTQAGQPHLRRRSCRASPTGDLHPV